MPILSYKSIFPMCVMVIAGLSVIAEENANVSNTYNGFEVITPSEANHIAGAVKPKSQAQAMINGSGLEPAKEPRHGLDMTHKWDEKGLKGCWFTDKPKVESKGKKPPKTPYFRVKNVVDPVVVFTLPAAYEVSGVALWNAPGKYDEAKRSVKGNDVGVEQTVWEIGESAEGPWQKLGQKKWKQGGKDRKSLEKVQIAQFRPAKGTHVRMTVKSNYKGQTVGIAEVRFFGKPAPAEPAASQDVVSAH